MGDPRPLPSSCAPSYTQMSHVACRAQGKTRSRQASSDSYELLGLSCKPVIGPADAVPYARLAIGAWSAYWFPPCAGEEVGQKGGGRSLRSFPALVGIETRHLGGYRCRVLTQVLFIDHPLMIDDKAHNA